MSETLERDFGRFVLHRRITTGGMAEVYEGVQKPPLQRRVAIKIPLRHLAEEPVFVERFEREARTVAMMQHPNIVEIYDYGEHQGRPFLAMEFIDGFDLKTWLETKHRPLPIEIALVVLRDVCMALEHAHSPERDVVHRDIKPSNVMISRDGAVKLMDFGLARAQQVDPSITHTGVIMGSTPYMSPEQCRGERIEGAAAKLSDIFSTGTMAYELLADTRPFPGDNREAIAEAIRTREPQGLAELNPLVPAGVAEVVHRMLRKLPAERTPDIGILLRELERSLADLGVTGARALLRDYVRDPARVAERLRRARPAAPPRPLAPPTPPRSRNGGRRPTRRLEILIGTAIALLVGVVVVALIVGLGPGGGSSGTSSGAGPRLDSTATGTTRAGGVPGGNADRADTAGGTTGGTIRPPDPRPPAAVRYRVSARPGFAWIYVDGSPRAYSPPCSIALGDGHHRFHLVNEQAGIDETLDCEITPSSRPGTLILDFELHRVIARR
jgi:serine/threonine-protein kinase